MAVGCNAFCNFGALSKTSRLAHDLICIPRLLLFAFVFPFPSSTLYGIALLSIHYGTTFRLDERMRAHACRRSDAEMPVVKSAEAVSLEYRTCGHPSGASRTPPAAVSAGEPARKVRIVANPDSLCCLLTRFETQIKHSLISISLCR